MSNNNIDEVRTNTLKQIERTESNYKLAFYGGVVVEALFFGAFVLLADFANRSHLLLFIASIAIYTILIAGLLALGMHVNRNTLRIIQAIEASRR